MADQLPLFGFREMKPQLKVALDKDLLLKGKEQYDKGDMKGATETMRKVREGLENICNRISNG